MLRYHINFILLNLCLVGTIQAHTSWQHCDRKELRRVFVAIMKGTHNMLHDHRRETEARYIIFTKHIMKVTEENIIQHNQALVKTMEENHKAMGSQIVKALDDLPVKVLRTAINYVKENHLQSNRALTKAYQQLLNAAMSAFKGQEMEVMQEHKSYMSQLETKIINHVDSTIEHLFAQNSSHASKVTKEIIQSHSQNGDKDSSESADKFETTERSGTEHKKSNDTAEEEAQEFKHSKHNSVGKHHDSEGDSQREDEKSTEPTDKDDKPEHSDTEHSNKKQHDKTVGEESEEIADKTKHSGAKNSRKKPHDTSQEEKSEEVTKEPKSDSKGKHRDSKDDKDNEDEEEDDDESEESEG